MHYFNFFIKISLPTHGISKLKAHKTNTTRCCSELIFRNREVLVDI